MTDLGSADSGFADMLALNFQTAKPLTLYFDRHIGLFSGI
jgi:hypothetical protein